MTKENLVILDPTKLRLQASKLQLGGTTVSATPSPYDIPEAVLSYENDKEGTYVIELKYMGSDEPVDTIDFGKDLQVKTGRNSKRVYAFVVHYEPRVFTKGRTLGTLRDAVSKMLIGESFPRKDNYRLLEKVLRDEGDKLVEQLSA